MHRLGAVTRRMVNLVYPPVCAGCGERGAWVCDRCAQDLVPMVPSLCCDRCGHPLLAAGCGCRDLHPAIVRVRSAAAYDGWLRQAIHGVKYRGESDRGTFLASLMVPLLPDDTGSLILVPVPLHHDREQMRGYNQARTLALAVGRETGIPVQNALVRTRSTHTQVTLNRDERRENLEGAFATTPGWKPEPGKQYMLVDDVFTTGATMWSCAETLDLAGAASVSALTVALDLLPRALQQYRQLYAISAGL